MSESFWEIIEEAKAKSGDDWESRPESLKTILKTKNPEFIHKFCIEYHNKLIEGYRWDLWGAAYLINGGCSDDGFDYFRDFLISEGKRVFEAAISEPDSLAELSDLEEVELELYRYAIDQAYEELTGNEMPPIDGDCPDMPTGEEWEEDELPSMFPKLAELYG